MTITLDAIGNPLSDGTWNYTWQHGRQLATMSNGTTAWSFTYNADGLRTKRTNGTTTYSYIYNGDKLSQMTVGSDALTFSYDASGTPMTVQYRGTTYYYVTNIQGDVIAILNGSGTAVVEYAYDAWGNLISTTGSMAASLGVQNPLRYRGYIYDQEYGLYYLQSRYYNPEIGRFLNADAFATTGQGLLGNNMFAYCNNNPANFQDSTGSKMVYMRADAPAPAGFPSPSAVSQTTNSGGSSGSAARKVEAFVTNTDEQKVLNAEYFSFYKGIPVVRTNGDRSGYFGIIFLTRETNNRSNPEDMIRHEYGHALQMQRLGIWRYATNIFLPSWLEWGSNLNYYSREVEITADILGGVISRTHTLEDIDAGFEYLDRSDKFGIIAWATIN